MPLLSIPYTLSWRKWEATLTTQEQAELLALMQVYQQRWVRQSEALAEAVRRGLRAPLTP
jgi:hypothetical protein